MNTAKKIVLFGLLLLSTQYSFTQIVKSTSWIGNTLSGKMGLSMQSSIGSLYSYPDGTIITNGIWSENANVQTLYKNGTYLNVVDTGSGGGGGATLGGYAVTGDGEFIYMAYAFAVFNGTNWVRRFQKNGNPAPFSYGDTLFKNNCLSDDSAIYGLAVAGNKIFISNSKRITVVDTTTGTVIQTWSVPGCADIHADQSGNIWVVQKKDSINAGKINCYNQTGTLLKSITTVVDPSGITINNQNRLLVCENGPRLQVLFYDISPATPVVIDSLGKRYGIYALPNPGEIQNDRLLFNMTDVTTDTSGNIYIASTAQGAEMRAYNSNKFFLWKLEGYLPQETAGFDPNSDGQSLFGHVRRIEMDYTKQAGQEWKLKAITVDKFKYPNDVRLLHNSPLIGFKKPVIRHIAGKKYMYYIGNTIVMVYRFDGEIAVPCGGFGSGSSRIPHPTSPDTLSTGWPQAWIWNDTNGNGDFNAGEWQSWPSISPFDDRAFSVDSLGSLWHVPYKGFGSDSIYKYPVVSIDGNGSPVYSMQARVAYPQPSSMTSINRIEHNASNNTLFLCGYTSTYPRTSKHEAQLVGSVIRRYDNWSILPTLAYELVLPFDTITPPLQPGGYSGFDIAGNTLVLVPFAQFPYYSPGWTNYYLNRAHVYLYNATNAQIIDSLKADSSVVWHEGWNDIDQPVTAFRRNNGELVVLVEEVVASKNTMHRVSNWFPATVEVAENSEAFDLFNLFPNPTQDALILNVSDPSIKVISMHNSLGQKLKFIPVKSPNTNIPIDVTGLPEGIYFLSAYNKDNITLGTKKFIKY